MRYLFLILFTVSLNAQILPSYQATHYKASSGSCSSSETFMALPDQSSPYAGNVRGYFFTAPIDFCITGLRVPTDASTGCQSLAIVRFTDGGPSNYPTLTNAFNQLHYSSCVAGENVIVVDISVSQGDIIGIYGNRSGSNSYGNPSEFNFTIGGEAVSVQRTGMQFTIVDNEMKDIWKEPSGSISRVEMHYKY
jgi:hypothetical protein